MENNLKIPKTSHKQHLDVLQKLVAFEDTCSDLGMYSVSVVNSIATLVFGCPGGVANLVRQRLSVA